MTTRTGDRELPRAPKLDIQLKCTSDEIIRDEYVHFPLKRKNYDDLRKDKEERLTMQILLVVSVPNETFDWLKQSEQEMILRRCGYWCSLMGDPATTNEHSITVKLPRQQQFTPDGLRQLMQKINDKELP